VRSYGDGVIFYTTAFVVTGGEPILFVVAAGRGE